MRCLLAILAFSLAGCASSGRKHAAASYSAPSIVQVSASLQDTKSAIRVAKQRLAEQNTAAAQAAMAVAETKAEIAEASVIDYAKKTEVLASNLNKAVDDKNAALDKVEYWHGKQVKGLKEIWFWRLLFGAEILAVLAWVGIRTSWTFRP
jgi:hypothetical protein